MNRKRLTNIQWRLTRFAIGICVFVTLVLAGLFLTYYHLDIRTVFTLHWFNVPFIIVLLLFAVIVGALFGYLYGNTMKRRLEQLVASILKFERGNFAHRVADLGDDEIGLMADHLNQMADTVEKQVASLQKLSTEKAEWNDQLKKSVISEERQRLARELHDAVSQQLFAISMMSSAVLESMGPGDEKVRSRIAMVEKMAGNAQNEMRALLMHLRPATLEGKGLKEGLEELFEEFRAKQPVDIRWEVADIPNLAKGIEDHLFRIVQEGMSNVFRHSQAASVTIRLSIVNRQLYLRIIDNGVGFDMDKPKTSSYGLQSIQERANEIGGVAEIISFPGKGVQIEVKVPILDKERK
ncbi:NarL family two-component system sensor histidine kinase LiaS [Scopulibacillus darangshiensis]|uniref:Sensor histidine kinase n=1 Tax=Scopulibacillus darangshiensis TaxID=442528 RepID=A0A4R2NBT0_9BACL|nr:sensor histidine kinase [Scopulibacillus darangshiensis]TCP18629.1 NarL family two-component system sensor histidine kinase LiaS [Scopulibacillus darangshiensis]